MLFGVYYTSFPALSFDPKQEITSWALFVIFLNPNDINKTHMVSINYLNTFFYNFIFPPSRNHCQTIRQYFIRVSLNVTINKYSNICITKNQIAQKAPKLRFPA